MVSSTQSMHGHTLGAAGAIEAVATVLALRHWVFPPTMNFLEPDAVCDRDEIPKLPRVAAVDGELSHFFAFGSLNELLALHELRSEGESV